MSDYYFLEIIIPHKSNNCFYKTKYELYQMKLKNYILLTFFFLSYYSFSQTYTMTNGVNATVTKCVGTFVDSGGSGSNYGFSESSTITFCPVNPTDKIKISFTAFDTEDDGFGGCYDQLDVFYASAPGSTTATPDETLCGNLGAFYRISTSPDGCISLRFTSDSVTNLAGWVATISCISPCVPPVAALTNSTTVDLCSPISSTTNSLTVPFDATPSSTPTGTITKYEWNWGDGTKSETTTPTTTHTFTSQGLFVVMLKVRNSNTGTDPLGCESTNAAIRTIRVMPPPNFTGSTTSTINVTCGSSTTLNTSIASQTVTQQTPSAVSATVSLPDGSGASFTSGIDYTGFFPAGTKMTAGCYPTLKFNLEHSWSSDISIDLIAPTGETVRIFNNGFGVSNKFGTCVNGADDGVPGCGADYTVVNSGGTNWPASGTTGTTTTTTKCTGYSGTCESGNYYKAGTYNSVNPFSAFDGAELNGVWTIKIIDHLAQDDGTLFSWSLSFPQSCYATLATVTPAINTAIWSNAVVGTGPAVPAQTPTSSAVSNPGPGTCPAAGLCNGNKLTNSVSVGPFNTVGSYIYNLTSTDQFGCQYVNPVTVNVTCLCPTATITYTPSVFCLNDAVSKTVILNGTLTYLGGTYSALPLGLKIDPNTGAIDPNLSTVGTYTVTYSLAATPGCSAINATTSVTISDVPSITTSIPSSRCGSGTVTLGATSSAGTINWYSNLTGGNSLGTGTTFTTPIISANTTYYVDATVGTCTTSTRTAILATINTIPTLTISCGTVTATSIQFNWNTIADATSYNYSYTVNGGSPIIGILASGTTTLNITSLSPGQTVAITVTPVGSICGLPANWNCVTSNCPLPTINQVGNTTVCGKDTIPAMNFTSNPAGATINWSCNNTAIGIIAASGTGTIPSFTVPNVTTQQIATITVTGNNGICTGPAMTFDIIINPLPLASISGTTSVCSGTGSNITFSGTPNVTVTYTVNSGSNQTVILDATGNYILPTGNLAADAIYSLVSVLNTVSGCSQNLSGTASVTVKPLATATISGTTSVCSGSSASITFSGTPNATVTYTLNSGANQAVVLDASGNYILPTGNLSADAIYALVSVLNTASGCSQSQTGTATVRVNTLPIATISGTTNICSGTSASITFSGTPNATVTYTLNSGTNQTVLLDASGNYVLPTGNLVADAVYALVSVSNGLTSCSQNQLGTASVTVKALATATISGTTNVCSGTSTPITFSGTPNATVTYTLNSGSNQTVVLDASGNYVLPTGNLVADAIYSLVSVSNGLSSCSQNQSGTASVHVNVLPSATISGSTNVCVGGSSTITFNGTPNATVTYTINSGANQTVVLDASGNFVLPSGNLAVNTVYSLVSVLNTTTSCSQSLTGSATISVNPVPTVLALPNNQTICSGQPTGILLTGTVPGTTFNWTTAQNGVTGALDANGTIISQVLTATGVATGSVDYTITPTANGCIGTPITVTVLVSPIPAVISSLSAQTICSGTAPSIALSSTVTGTSFNWNVVQTNVTGASAGTGNSIAQVLTTVGNKAGEAVYSIIPNINGCQGLPILVTITVNPIPVATVNSALATICSGNNTSIALTSNVAGTTFSWASAQIGVIGASAGIGDTISQTLTTSGLVFGTVDYTITPSFNGCAGTPIVAKITVNPTPEVFGSAGSTLCSGQYTNILLSPSIPGTQFAWTVVQTGVTGATDGTGDTIAQMLEAGTILGTAVYTVIPTLNNCSGNSIKITINVNPAPTPAIAEGVICVDATGTTLQTYTFDTNLSTTNYTFEWYYNAALIPGAVGSSYEATKDGNYSVIATNSLTGCVSKEAFATIIANNPAISLDTVVTDAFTQDATIIATVNGGTGPFLYQIDGGVFQSSNVFFGLSSGTHTINVKDAEGCTNLTNQTKIIDYPKYFTPNGDGHNDSWNISGLNDQPDAKIFIYDRYGKLIKEISTVGNGWDGTYNGKALPATDYWFTVEYTENNINKLFKAHFGLKR